jgi:serine/threonine-protein kinase
MPLADGANFAGYTIRHLLGSGGMGEVYLADHPRLPRLDALKILPASLTTDDDFRGRFNREADLAASLWHPNIVGLHDRGEFEGQLWITMDYVDGVDAGRLLREHPAGLLTADAIEIVSAVAEALDYAHQRNLLHRDVKPANILATRAGTDRRRILLADFGIARRSDDISGLTVTNMTVGSVAYAAPEQLMGEPMDGRADQYALAATTFRLLTGAQLFKHSNAAVVISKHLNAPPPPISQWRSDLTHLDPILSRALAKDPAGRYASCGEFARALQGGIRETPRHRPEHTQTAWALPPRPAPPLAFDATQAAMTQQAIPSMTASTAATKPPRGASTRRLATATIVLALLACAAIGFAVDVSQRRPQPGPSNAAPQWQPYVDYARQFTASMMSVSTLTADSDYQRMVDGSTGSLHDELANPNSGIRQGMIDAHTTTRADIVAAALDSLGNSTAQVLVVTKTTTTKEGSAPGAPTLFRVAVEVQRIGDAYKASRMEFVQ